VKRINVSKTQIVYLLALTGGKILFVFSLKTKRFGRKAGIWFPEYPIDSLLILRMEMMLTVEIWALNCYLCPNYL